MNSKQCETKCGNTFKRESAGDKISVDITMKVEKENIPPCRNGDNCPFLVRGVCIFYHRNVGFQKRISTKEFNYNKLELSSAKLSSLS